MIPSISGPIAAMQSSRYLMFWKNSTGKYRLCITLSNATFVQSCQTPKFSGTFVHNDTTSRDNNIKLFFILLKGFSAVSIIFSNRFAKQHDKHLEKWLNGDWIHETIGLKRTSLYWSLLLLVYSSLPVNQDNIFIFFNLTLLKPILHFSFWNYKKISN